MLGTPDIDLFATRFNHQLPMYVCWKSDPGAVAVDALVESWGVFFLYIFSPYNLISKILGKIENAIAATIVIFLFWRTQSWFPKFLKLTQITYLSAGAALFSVIHDETRKNCPEPSFWLGLIYTQPSDKRISPRQQKALSRLHGKFHTNVI